MSHLEARKCPEANERKKQESFLYFPSACTSEFVQLPNCLVHLLRVLPSKILDILDAGEIYIPLTINFQTLLCLNRTWTIIIWNTHTGIIYFMSLDKIKIFIYIYLYFYIYLSILKIHSNPILFVSNFKDENKKINYSLWIKFYNSKLISYVSHIYLFLVTGK